MSVFHTARNRMRASGRQAPQCGTDEASSCRSTERCWRRGTEPRCPNEGRGIGTGYAVNRAGRSTASLNNAGAAAPAIGTNARVPRYQVKACARGCG